jgi:hypothetical protein
MLLSVILCMEPRILYHIHILYHLPHLEYIDGFHLSTQQVAEQAEVCVVLMFSFDVKYTALSRSVCQCHIHIGNGNEKENVVSYEIENIRT